MTYFDLSLSQKLSFDSWVRPTASEMLYTDKLLANIGGRNQVHRSSTGMNTDLALQLQSKLQVMWQTLTQKCDTHNY